MTYLTGCCFGLNCGARSTGEMSVLCCFPASLHSCPVFYSCQKTQSLSMFTLPQFSHEGSMTQH